MEPEPKLAAEIVAQVEDMRQTTKVAADAQAPQIAEQPEDSVEAQVNLEILKPLKTISVTRMNKFALRIRAQEA